MPHALSHDLHSIHRSVTWVGGLSDSLVKLGPFSIGVDGVLAWIPFVGETYSTAAAIFLLVQGVRARVPVSILLSAAALMGSRTVISAVPLAGPAAADLMMAHKWSARMIGKAIERRIARGEAAVVSRANAHDLNFAAPAAPTSA